MKLLIPPAIFSLLDKNILLSALLSNHLNCVSVEGHVAVSFITYQVTNVLEKPVASVFRLGIATLKMGWVDNKETSIHFTTLHSVTS